jgi:hypothetical protein
MPITGGGDRRDLRPLNPDGHWRDREFGSHRGAASALNVRGLKPGMIPFWVRHPNRDRGAAQLQRFVNQGWEVAPPEAQIRKGPVTDPNYAALGLDRYPAHGDIVLLQISEENYRRFCAARDQQRDAAVEGPTREFLRKGEPVQNRFGDRADGPIYYVGPGHGRSSQ